VRPCLFFCAIAFILPMLIAMSRAMRTFADLPAEDVKELWESSKRGSLVHVGQELSKTASFRWSNTQGHQ
jgi:hypothetical protein